MERGMDTGVERSCPAVLLVEDDPSLGDILGKNLEARGYRVHRAETLAQALESLAGEAPPRRESARAMTCRAPVPT